jgi:ADP-ribose pyrophosphatase YjhB (NUDIX family)
MINRFNIRVYGIVLDPARGLLLTDEIRGGRRMTKLPGGGLEFGEGLADCLRREFREELELEIEIQKLIYANEFLQVSAFNPKDQVISIYYQVNLMGNLPESAIRAKFDFATEHEGAQHFRYVPLALLDPDEMTFPIDRKVVSLLKDQR